MSPPKIIVNFHPEPNGKGDPMQQPATFEAKGDGSEPVLEVPAVPRPPRLAMSMSIQFDDPIPAAEIIPDAILPELKA